MTLAEELRSRNFSEYINSSQSKDFTNVVRASGIYGQWSVIALSYRLPTNLEVVMVGSTRSLERDFNIILAIKSCEPCFYYSVRAPKLWRSDARQPRRRLQNY